MINLFIYIILAIAFTSIISYSVLEIEESVWKIKNNRTINKIFSWIILYPLLDYFIKKINKSDNKEPNKLHRINQSSLSFLTFRLSEFFEFTLSAYNYKAQIPQYTFSIIKIIVVASISHLFLNGLAIKLDSVYKYIYSIYD
ncbi:hypothetical protein [Spirosoma validum]|uniref:Uncharacterized protein n=1 Tax=Spirosoma validum TaxID=2771355 RepID=A0A927GCB9_9BACT|nr:hypothetical protein [Spirosoma validum]MBD2752602.1 hypothetical protein [Spirosoma validum]